MKNMHATAPSLFLFHRFRKFPAIVPAQFLALLVRSPLTAQAVVDHLEPGTLEQFRDLLDRLPAPAVASESGRLLVLEFQPPDHFHDPANGEQIPVIDGGGPYQDGFGFEDFSDDVILVVHRREDSRSNPGTIP